MKLKQLNKKIIDLVLNGSLEPVEKKWSEYNRFLTLRLDCDTDFMCKLYNCSKAQLRQRQLYILRVLNKYLVINDEDDKAIYFTYQVYDSKQNKFLPRSITYVKRYNTILG